MFERKNAVFQSFGLPQIFGLATPLSTRTHLR